MYSFIFITLSYKKLNIYLDTAERVGPHTGDSYSRTEKGIFIQNLTSSQANDHQRKQSIPFTYHMIECKTREEE